MIKLAFLSTEIQRDILAGRQSPRLTLAALLEGNFPLLWSEQRALLAK